MRTASLALVSLLLAANLHAQERPNLKLQTLSWIALAGGQTADVVTTFRALPMGGGHCVEGNSGVYGTSPSLKQLVITKLVIAAPVAAVTIWADHRGSHRVANIGRVVFGAVGAGTAVWNGTKTCR